MVGGEESRGRESKRGDGEGERFCNSPLVFSLPPSAKSNHAKTSSSSSSYSCTNPDRREKKFNNLPPTCLWMPVNLSLNRRIPIPPLWSPPSYLLFLPLVRPDTSSSSFSSFSHFPIGVIVLSDSCYQAPSLPPLHDCLGETQ